MVFCVSVLDKIIILFLYTESYHCDLENYRDCFLEQSYFDHQDWTWYKPDSLQNNGPSDDHTSPAAAEGIKTLILILSLNAHTHTHTLNK